MQATERRPARARRLPADERKRQILDAAVDVFARLGYSAAGTADIAAAAGIGEPTIYRYFTNKREVYLAAIRRASDEILSNWEQLAADAPDALTALRQIGLWYFRRLQDRPELLMLRSRSISESPDQETLAAVRTEYLRVLHFVQSAFERAQQEGQIEASEDVKTLAWIYMAVGALLDQSFILGLGDELTPEQVIRLAQLIQPGSR
jgi:TetR/AcrR family transcriptional regulator